MDTKAKPTNSFGKFTHQCSLQRTAGNDAFVNDAAGAAPLNSPEHGPKYPSKISVSGSPGRWYQPCQTHIARSSRRHVDILQTLPRSRSCGPRAAGRADLGPPRAGNRSAVTSDKTQKIFSCAQDH